MFTKEMIKALEADGEKLRQLTDQDHGPDFEPRCDCGWLFEICNHPNCPCGPSLSPQE